MKGEESPGVIPRLPRAEVISLSDKSTENWGRCSDGKIRFSATEMVWSERWYGGEGRRKEQPKYISPGSMPLLPCGSSHAGMGDSLGETAAVGVTA